VSRAPSASAVGFECASRAAYAWTMDGRLGLDSISFETFAWPAEYDDANDRRAWLGEGVVLTEHFFPVLPDLPSLDPQEIRLMYEDGPRAERTPRWRRALSSPAARRSDSLRTTRVIELAVSRGATLPIVRSIVRIPVFDHYAFVAALTLPLAECSWVVRLQTAEMDVTGVREAIALDFFLRGEAPSGRQTSQAPVEGTLEEVTAGFDPYQPCWDGPTDDPLTIARRHITTVEQSLVFRPEVFDQPPFHGQTS
jgi:hypothetical protein